ncbi:hypothetical protein QYE76_038019 [Lolium multiflorum]|uniref:DUF8039 domain-containing protein n=1 Tax=Lolium multiflorum TaxID=4521 RepID=A0AAD8T8T0_LOLMU|nr:hypothetical protein QYE76_038019 [Lolium multiflorum]
MTGWPSSNADLTSSGRFSSSSGRLSKGRASQIIPPAYLSGEAAWLTRAPPECTRMIDGGPGYPVDGIKEQTPCDLHEVFMNISLKVAVGYVLPTLGPEGEPALWRGNEIPAGYAHVGVDSIVPSFESLQLEIPGGFMPSYNCWTKHGGRGVMMEGNEEEENDDDMYPNYGDTATGYDEDEEAGGAEDKEASDEPVDNDLHRAIADAYREAETENEKRKLKGMLEDHKKSYTQIAKMATQSSRCLLPLLYLRELRVHLIRCCPPGCRLLPQLLLQLLPLLYLGELRVHLHRRQVPQLQCRAAPWPPPSARVGVRAAASCLAAALRAQPARPATAPLVLSAAAAASSSPTAATLLLSSAPAALLVPAGPAAAPRASRCRFIRSRPVRPPVTMPIPHPHRAGLGDGHVLEQMTDDVRDWAPPGWHWEVLPSGVRILVRNPGPIVDPDFRWWRSRGPRSVQREPAPEEVVQQRIIEEDEHVRHYMKLLVNFILPEPTEAERENDRPDPEDPELNIVQRRVERWALKKMATQFNSYKKKLDKDFVQQKKTPDFNGPFEKIKDQWDEFVKYKTSERAMTRSATNKTNASKKMYFHTLGQGGYKAGWPKWKKREDDLIGKGIQPEVSVAYPVLSTEPAFSTAAAVSVASPVSSAPAFSDVAPAFSTAASAFSAAASAFSAAASAFSAAAAH